MKETRMPWLYDDGGRAAAGYKGDTGDCVVRAIAIATEQPYKTVYEAINVIARAQRPSRRERRGSSARTGVYRRVYEPYLQNLGWTWTPTMAIGTGTTVHLCADDLPSGRLVVALSKHLATVIDGILHDTADCSRGGTRCVYGFYRCGTEKDRH